MANKGFLIKKNILKEIKNINNLLLTIRNINQLIVQGKNLSSLIKKTAELIVQNRNYLAVWLLVNNEQAKKPYFTFAFQKKSSLALKKYFKNFQSPNLSCLEKLKKLKKYTYIKKPQAECADFPLFPFLKDKTQFIIPFIYQKKWYGALGVIFPHKFKLSNNEESLLKEVAVDLSFAFHSLNLSQKQNEAMAIIKKNEAKLSSIFRSAPVGIGLVKDRVLLDVNERILKMTGYTKKELIGKNARILYPTQEDYEYVGKEKYRQISRQGIGTVETRWQKKDGTIIEILLSATPLILNDLSAGITFTALDITHQKKLQINLENSLQDWLITFNAIKDFICLLDKDHYILRCNEAMLKQFKIKPSDYGKIHCWELVHNLKEPLAECPIVRINKTLKKETIEIEIKDRWYEITVIPILNANGSLQGSVHIMHDITEARKILEELRIERDRSKLYLELANVIFIALDQKGKVILLNQKACEILGGTKEEILGKNWFDNFIPSNLKNSIKEEFESILSQTKQAIDYYENPILTLQGQERLVAWHNTYLKDAKGQIIEVVSAGEDITEQRELENKLKIFQQAVENSTDAITIVNQEGKHLYQNKIFEELFGDVRSYPFPLPVKENGFFSKVLNTIKNGQNWNSEIKMHTKQGEEHEFLLRIYPSCDQKNEFSILVCNLADITEKKKAEREQQIIQDQLIQAHRLESIGRLAGGIAHDFNNLLTVINGFCELILNNLKEGDPYYSELSAIFKAGLKAKYITAQLLAFSRKQPVAPKNINLNSVIYNLTIMLKRLIGEDIEFKLKVAPDLPPILADQTQIEQIITNLIVNAREALALNTETEKKIILLEAGTSSLDEDFCQKNPGLGPGEYVYFAVSDTGPGISPKDQLKVFEPFFTTKKTGTGLGLSTVYGIVKQNKAFIILNSEVKKGSCFKIYWPISKSTFKTEIKSAEENINQLEALKGRGKILLVEDEPDVLSFAQKVLTYLGYKVFPMSNPKKALEKFEKEDIKFDLLITDLIMPGINGRELAKKYLKRLPGLKVLFVSGYSTEYISIEEIELENLNLLSKPYSALDLAKAVFRLLNP